MALVPGEVTNGRYRIESILGRFGEGERILNFSYSQLRTECVVCL